jgi:hypothetical protein
MLMDSRYLSVTFIILLMSLGDVDVDDRSKSSKSVKRFLNSFLINVLLLKVASHKYINLKNIKISFTFNKRERYQYSSSIF